MKEHENWGRDIKNGLENHLFCIVVNKSKTLHINWEIFLSLHTHTHLFTYIHMYIFDHKQIHTNLLNDTYTCTNKNIFRNKCMQAFVHVFKCKYCMGAGKLAGLCTRARIYLIM